VTSTKPNLYLGIAVGLGLLGVLYPATLLPAFFFALLSMRRRALVGAFVALASLAAAGFTALVLLDLDTGDQTGPSPDATETYVLNQYFTNLQSRCMSGNGPGWGECADAFNLVGQQRLLSAYGWPECRTRGGSPTQCVTHLP
jgi:hypothetical protein